MKKIIKRQHSANFIARLLPRRFYLLLLLIIGTALTSCEENEAVAPEGCFFGEGPCGTYVTVKSAMCGVGIWGNYWLQLDNGEWLQPWDSQTGLPDKVAVGQRFRIGYTEIARDDKYANVITCMAVPVPAKAIQITCFEAVVAPACETVATVVMDDCFPSYWGEVSLQLDNGELLRPWEGMALNQPLQNGQRIKIGYEVSQAEKKYGQHCQTLVALPPFTPAKITCLTILPTAPGNCAVFATAETVVCGAGVWANRWLRLDDGTYLQPWESMVPNFQLQNGARYKIGYEAMARDSRYNDAVICSAMPPQANVVRITCIEPVGANSK